MAEMVSNKCLHTPLPIALYFNGLGGCMSFGFGPGPNSVAQPSLAPLKICLNQGQYNLAGEENVIWENGWV